MFTSRTTGEGKTADRQWTLHVAHPAYPVQLLHLTYIIPTFRYLAISKECGYDPLGKPVCDKEFELFRQDVGVLEEAA